jgi:hypothetical protein
MGLYSRRCLPSVVGLSACPAVNLASLSPQCWSRRMGVSQNGNMDRRLGFGLFPNGCIRRIGRRRRVNRAGIPIYVQKEET